MPLLPAMVKVDIVCSKGISKVLASIESSMVAVPIPNSKQAMIGPISAAMLTFSPVVPVHGKGA